MGEILVLVDNDIQEAIPDVTEKEKVVNKTLTETEAVNVSQIPEGCKRRGKKKSNDWKLRAE